MHVKNCCLLFYMTASLPSYMNIIIRCVAEGMLVGSLWFNVHIQQYFNYIVTRELFSFKI